MSARALFAAIAAAVPLLFSGLAAGHGGDVPYHKSGGAYCYVEGSLGAIRAYPPVQMHAVTGTYDTVYWRAEVYRKRGRSWRRYITGMPWLSRTTDRSGRLNASLGPWMHWSRGTGHKFWRFTGLPRGLYRVGEIYRWSNGTVHTQWSLYSWNRNVSYQCEIS